MTSTSSSACSWISETGTRRHLVFKLQNTENRMSLQKKQWRDETVWGSAQLLSAVFTLRRVRRDGSQLITSDTLRHYQISNLTLIIPSLSGLLISFSSVICHRLHICIKAIYIYIYIFIDIHIVSISIFIYKYYALNKSYFNKERKKLWCKPEVIIRCNQTVWRNFVF